MKVTILLLVNKELVALDNNRCPHLLHQRGSWPPLPKKSLSRKKLQTTKRVLMLLLLSCHPYIWPPLSVATTTVLLSETRKRRERQSTEQVGIQPNEKRRLLRKTKRILQLLILLQKRKFLSRKQL